MLWTSLRWPCLLLTAVASQAVAAPASNSTGKGTEVSLSLDLLEYETTNTKVKVDSTDNKKDETKVRAIPRHLELEVYGRSLGLKLYVPSSKDDAGAAYGFFNFAPNLYAGLYLSYKDTKTKTKSGDADAVTAKDSAILVGPAFQFRQLTAQSLMLGRLTLASAKTEETTDKDNSTTTKFTLIILEGGYMVNVIPRLYLGGGFGYLKSLSGSGDSKASGTSTSFDIELTTLSLMPLQMMVTL